MSTLTKHDCVLCLVGVLVSSNLSSHFNSVPLTSLKVRDGVVDSIQGLYDLGGCHWRRCDCNVDVVVALWCHGDIYNTVVVAKAIAIVDKTVLFGITCKVGQHTFGCIQVVVDE